MIRQDYFIIVSICSVYGLVFACIIELFIQI